MIKGMRTIWAGAAALLLSGCVAATIPPQIIRQDAHVSGGTIVAFDNTTDRLASSGRAGRIRVWNLPGLQRSASWPAHERSIYGLAFVDSGKRLVSAGYEGTLALWTPAGELVRRKAVPGALRHAVVHEATDRILTGHGDGYVRLWRLSDFTLVGERLLHRGAVRVVALSADGRQAASGGADGRVFTWTVDGARARELAPPPTDTWSLVFADDGRRLFGGGWFDLFRWNLHSGALSVLDTEHHGILRGLAFTPDKELATISRQTDSAVYILDPESGATRKRYRPHDLCGGDIAVSRDGRYLASTSDDASVRLWRLNDTLSQGQR